MYYVSLEKIGDNKAISSKSPRKIYVTGDKDYITHFTTKFF